MGLFDNFNPSFLGTPEGLAALSIFDASVTPREIGAPSPIGVGIHTYQTALKDKMEQDFKKQQMQIQKGQYDISQQEHNLKLAEMAADAKAHQEFRAKLPTLPPQIQQMYAAGGWGAIKELQKTIHLKENESAVSPYLALLGDQGNAPVQSSGVGDHPPEVLNGMTPIDPNAPPEFGTSPALSQAVSPAPVAVTPSVPPVGVPKTQNAPGVLFQGTPKPTPAPTQRNYIKGNQHLTDQWNAKTGQWENVATAPREKPMQVKVGLLGEDAITQAANDFRTTGTMPALGMGNQLDRARILNKAAELAKAEGKTAEESTLWKLANKAKLGAVSQLEKQATMVGAFEKTANSNLDLALSLSNKVDRTGAPVFEKWIQAGRKGLAGSPEVAQFHAANETFLNEYAKIMSGSMGNTPISDAARANAHEILNSAFTKEQYQAVMKTLKTEMQNRIKGFDDQRKEIMGGVADGGKAKMGTGTVLRFDAQGTPIP